MEPSRGVEILRALGEGELFVDKDGKAYVAKGARIVDALSGAAASVDKSTLSQVRLNNRVRVAVRGAIGKLGLLSPDPAQRLAAARAVFQTRSVDNIELLEKSLANETDRAGETPTLSAPLLFVSDASIDNALGTSTPAQVGDQVSAAWAAPARP